MQFDETILRSLIHIKDYRDKVLPFLRAEYFHDHIDKMVYEELHSFMSHYNSAPSREALILIFKERGDLNEEAFKAVLAKLKIVTHNKNVETNLDWLLKETEKFCQDKAIYNAVMDSIQIIDGLDKNKSPSIIPDLMRTALGVSFDTSIGHDYWKDADERFTYYTKDHTHIPCDLFYINKITNGGVCPETLNIAMADTNVGKTIFLCHVAASYITNGLKVAYVTGEESENQIAKRIDANLLDIPMDSFKNLDKSVYDAKIERARGDKNGLLKIKEYPSGGFTAATVRQLLDEYKNKEGFVPDILIVDYLGLMSCERWKPGSVRHDLYMQFTAEELRNIAKQYHIPVWTGWQSNRDGAETTEAGKKNVGDSYGVLRTADLFFIMMTSEELEARNQLLFKQLKSRYGPTDKPRRFVIGIDKSKMRLYDVEDQFQQKLNERDKKTDLEKGKPVKQVKKNGFRF